MKLNCYHCGYKWNSKSVKLWVTCPNCTKKINTKKK